MKICVGLSGGVDSSVAALLLKQQGYDVFAMFMQNWHDTEGTLHGDCEWEEDRFVAEMVARKIGIPFYFVDLSKEYRARVVDYMFDEYARGRTPNPDVLCNREIKFDAFLQAATRLGADCVATGHYCRREVAPDGTYRLLSGVDPGKDQSYFLCQLTQDQLSRAMFPIGHLLKKEVRQQKLKSVAGEVVEVYDAYYDADPLYTRQLAWLSSLVVEGTEFHPVTSYISEDKSTSAVARNQFDPTRLAALTDEDLALLATPLHYEIAFETETYRSGKKYQLYGVYLFEHKNCAQSEYPKEQPKAYGRESCCLQSVWEEHCSCH